MKKDFNPFEVLGNKLVQNASRPNINNYNPHEKQIPFHKSTAMITQYIGGNRSGKTTGGVAEDIYYAKGEHPFKKIPPAPNNIRVCTVDFKVGLSQLLLPELAKWCPPSLLINGSWEDSYQKEPPELSFSNGSMIEFKSYEQDLVKFAGTSRALIHHDEEPPEDIYKENLMRIIDCNGRITFTMTPVDGMTWTYDQIYLKGKPDDGSPGAPHIEVIEADMLDNPYISEIVAQVALAGLDANEKAARKQGKYVMIGGLIYPSFNEATHVIEHYEIPNNQLVFASMDHGLANPTAWLWHTVEPNGRVITFAEHYKNEMTVQQHAVEYHRMNEKIGRVPEYNVGDPSIKARDKITMTSVQQEYIKNGIFITLGNNDKLAGINRVREYLRAHDKETDQPMWLITQNCTNLIWEMKRYRRKRYANSKITEQHNAQEEPVDKDNHALDSSRYFFMSRPDLKILGPKIKGLERMGNILHAPSAVPAMGRIVEAIPNSTAWATAASTNNNGWETYADEYLGGNW